MKISTESNTVAIRWALSTSTFKYERFNVEKEFAKISSDLIISTDRSIQIETVLRIGNRRNKKK